VLDASKVEVRREGGKEGRTVITQQRDMLDPVLWGCESHLQYFYRRFHIIARDGGLAATARVEQPMDGWYRHAGAGTGPTRRKTTSLRASSSDAASQVQVFVIPVLRWSVVMKDWRA